MLKVLESNTDIYYWNGIDDVPEDVVNVVIEDGVNSIKMCAFKERENLKSVTIPNTVMIIENSAFEQCESLEKIDIPNSVDIIGVNAFFLCTSLKSIVIPNTVGEVKSGAFQFCSGLTEAKLSGSTIYQDCIFEHCIGLKKVIIPEGVNKITYGMFMGCSNLTSVVIPKSVKTIDRGAFEDCTKLTDIEILGSPHIDEYAFYNVLTVEQAYELIGEKVLTPNNIYKYKDELLDIVDKYMADKINKGYNRCYILPNGNFLTNKKISEKASVPHRFSDYELEEILKEDLYWVVIGFNLNGALGNNIFDMLGCIRVNAEAENYIALPKDRITSAQQASLEDWLNWLFYTKDRGLITVTDYKDGQQITYHRNEYDPKEIVQKINRFYNTGNLYENKRVVRKMAKRRFLEDDQIKLQGFEDKVAYLSTRNYDAFYEEIFDTFKEAYEDAREYEDGLVYKIELDFNGDENEEVDRELLWQYEVIATQHYPESNNGGADTCLYDDIIVFDGDRPVSTGSGHSYDTCTKYLNYAKQAYRNWESDYDTELEAQDYIADAMDKHFGGNWVIEQIHGAYQGEWADILYDTQLHSEESIEAFVYDYYAIGYDYECEYTEDGDTVWCFVSDLEDREIHEVIADITGVDKDKVFIKEM